MNETVSVSVLCMTYNHEAYIRETLDGFVGQKTTFRFEVIIHDDASTDATAAILREYEAKYPDIIRPIYQKENQYSQGISIPDVHLLPRVRGKYTAWCEGDDCWTDPCKLQKQFDFMEAHPEHSLCLHRTLKHWCTPDGQDSVGPEQDGDRDYSLAEVMSREHFFALASVFVRSEVYLSMPECFRSKTCGDIPLFLYASIAGKVHCLQDVMAVYNYRREGSFTKEFFRNHEKKIAHNRDLLEMFRRIDEYYDFRYTKELSAAIRYHEYHLYKHTGELDRISGAEYDAIREKDRQRLARLAEINSAAK